MTKPVEQITNSGQLIMLKNIFTPLTEAPAPLFRRVARRCAATWLPGPSCQPQPADFIHLHTTSSSNVGV
jgi:hypothetical protein